MNARSAAPWMAGLFLVAGGCSGGAEDCADLGARLASSMRGQTVTLGACTVTGPLSVPRGVTLQGAGIGRSVVVAPPGAVALTLEPGAQLSGLTVESQGAGGIRGGGGALRLQDVEVRAQRGYALRLEGGDGVVLSRVTLLGPVTVANADDVPASPGPEDTATHGLVLVGTRDAMSAVLEDVTIRGFGRFGALFLDSTVVWNDGMVEQNLGTGIMASGGEVALARVEVRQTLQGVQPMPAYGAVFSAGARVSTQGLVLRDNDGLGLIQDGAEGTHVDLVAERNGDAAVWAQRSPWLAISGASSLVGNALAGVVTVDTPTTVIGATIDGTRLATRVDGEVGTIRVGDGIEAVLGDASSLRVEGVTLAGNERAGVLIDADTDNLPPGVVMDVSVSGTGAQMGVIAQGPSGIIPSGEWDATVTRLGDTLGNDEAASGPLDIVGLIGPMFLPRDP